MTDGAGDRRDFLKLAAVAGLGAGLLPPALARALARPAHGPTGTIRDVEHVVILMQENRSFDHYFGTLRGVRGYGDPRPITLPSGDPVWRQPGKAGGAPVAPFHLDTTKTRAETMFSLDHSWKGSHDRWKHHDAWIPAKTPLTMGYFTRADIPFYYALADAFTICDGYHCSIFAQTNPNRLFLFSGTSGLAAGDDSRIVVENPKDETSYFADPARDSPKFKGLTWPTYAERLEKAGVSWRVYQEYENYGDNGLSYFANFRGIGPETSLYKRGRAWAPGSTADNYKASNGEALVSQFEADVAGGQLPQVSWIVTSYKLSEHPQASPSDGEHLVARLLNVLASHPDVWAKTAFILNYDENDGFFDHVPPPIPAVGAAWGKSSVSTDHEDYHGEPVGLGPRVPLIVVSPWTRGGFVNSQVFDHTSVIRFLETRFGVKEPQISPWRRTVCGDLTSVFDFAAAGPPQPLPDAAALPARAEAAKALPFPTPDVPQGAPRQEPGQRPARALPYDLKVSSTATPKGLALKIANTGRAGAALNLYIRDGEPRFYTAGVGAGLDDVLPLAAGPYRFDLHGPNGFLRSFAGPPGAGAEAAAEFDARQGRLIVRLTNPGPAPVTLTVAPGAYLEAPARTHALAPGATLIDAWDLKLSANWYDFSVTSADVPGFLRRFAGHGEDGRPSLSDPLLGRQI